MVKEMRKDPNYEALAKAKLRHIEYDFDWRKNPVANGNALQALAIYADSAIDEQLEDLCSELKRNKNEYSAERLSEALKIRLAWLQVLDLLLATYVRGNPTGITLSSYCGAAAKEHDLSRVVFRVHTPNAGILSVSISPTDSGKLTKSVKGLPGMECQAKIWGDAKDVSGLPLQYAVYYCHMKELKPKLDEWLLKIRR